MIKDMELDRLARERKTVEVMVRLYCAHHHQTHWLCDDCQKLTAYALDRLNCCPFGQRKPVCSGCPIHCYRPEMQNQIKAVMRYSGPRLFWRHPILAIRHLTDRVFY